MIKETLKSKLYQALPLGLAFIIVMIMVIGGTSLYYLENYLVYSAGDSLILATDSIAAKLDRVLYENYQNAQTMAKANVLQQLDPTDIWSYLRSRERDSAFFDWIEVTNSQGEVISSTDLTRLGRDRSREPWFQEVIDFNRTSIQDASFSENLDVVMDVVFASPIINTESTFVGTASAHMGILGFKKLFVRTLEPLQKKYGEAASIEWQILNQDGLVILDSLLGEEGKVNLRNMGLPSAQPGMGDSAGFIEERHLRRGVDVITGYSSTRGLMDMPNLNWTVLVRLDRESILQPVHDIRLKVAGVSFLLIGPLVGLMIWAMRRLQNEHQQLKEHNLLTEFEAKITQHLNEDKNMQAALQACTEAMATFLDAALARIWTLNEAKQILELQASAGLYTHIDGPHGRVPVGQFKIGKIASERQPHLTNHVIGDPRVPEQEWAKREGLVAFAGYPLMVGNQVVGVMAIFARHSLSDLVQKMMRLSASRIAQSMSRKQAEEAAAQLLRQNQLILYSAGEGIYGLDTNGVTTFVNPAGARMLGYDSDELIGLPMHAAIHHTKANGIAYPREECPMYAAFKDGTVHQVENEVLWRKDGTCIQVEYTSTPIRDETGSISGAVVTFRDVTERKRMKDDLVDLMMLTQGIVDTAPDGIITIDESGTIESFNQAATKIFGYSDAEVLGSNVTVLMPSPYREQHDEYLSRYRQTGERKIIGFGREVLGLRKDGSIFPLDLSVGEVQMEHRRVFSGIVRDLSERKESERRLGQMHKDLERKNKDLMQARDQALEAVRLKSEFLAMMSHEIRTPMNGVLGMTGMLLESDLTQDQRDCAETVKNSAEALLTIINDILDFSKIESGKLEIEVIDFDLRTAVEEVLDLIGAKAQEKGLELVGLVYASVPTAVRGDPGRFRQILLNLVGNAIKFTEQGEVVIQVVPETETTDEVLLRVDVTDTGIGLSSEAQQRLFQPFSQADGSTTRKYGGTGLGLAISKQLVELMQGTIGVESYPGQGSRFWFTVHLGKQPPKLESRELNTQMIEGRRACVVNDNDTNRLLMHHYMSAWGMSCLTADSGQTALVLLKDAVERGEPCDLLVLDMQMLEMDGIELARQVKADSILAATKIVMVTSMGRRGDAAVAREAGISAYLTKPIHHHQLRECLCLVMNGASNGETSFVTKYTIRETKQQTNARLLVADDNVVNQKVAVRMLEKLGCRVDVVANGAEAVEAVSRIPYDVVFMDCQMPEMDGYEATREIRRGEALSVNREAENREDSEASSQRRDTRYERPKTSHVPIIAMTANAMKGDREKCLNAGMDDFVSKPVKIEDLEVVLKRWVQTDILAEEALARKEQGGTMVENTQQSRHESLEANPPLDAETLDGLRELAGDDLSFLSDVIQQFLQDGPGHVSAIRQAVEGADADALMKAAHGFKGCCRNMGALPLGDFCFALEQKGQAGEMTHVEVLLHDVDQEYCRVQVALRAELEKLITLSSSSGSLPHSE